MKNIFIFSLIIVLLLKSCMSNDDFEPVYHPLPDSLKFRFNTGDTFIYQSNKSQYDSFIVKVKQSHNVQGYDDYEIITVKYHNIELYDTVDINSDSVFSNSTIKMNFYIKTYKIFISIFGASISELYRNSGYQNSTFYKQIEIQDTLYNNVYEFIENNTDSNEVYKIQFQHQYGILRYYFNNGAIFELKEIKAGN